MYRAKTDVGVFHAFMSYGQITPSNQFYINNELLYTDKSLILYFFPFISITISFILMRDPHFIFTRPDIFLEMNEQLT